MENYEVGEKIDLLAEATYKQYSDITTDTDVAAVEFGVDEIGKQTG